MTRFLTTTLALAAAAVMSACAGRTASEPATVGDPSTAEGGTSNNLRGDTLRVKFAQTVELQRTGLKLTFQRLVGDSRCAINAICVWEGDAHVAVRLQRGAVVSDQELHTSQRMGATSVSFEGYDVTFFGLTPAPVADRPKPADSEFTALFVVKAK